MTLTTCIHCGVYVDPELGAMPPGSTGDRAGTADEPLAPGDFDNVCEVCNYRDGKHGHPTKDYGDAEGESR